MYCPEDGTPIPEYADRKYTPCPACGTVWRYDGENGRYEVESTVSFNVPSEGMGLGVDASDRGFAATPEGVHPLGDLTEALRGLGERRRALGVDRLVAQIVDVMEKKAVSDGQCTYYMGTYAVARETLITAGLTCERDPAYGPYTEFSSKRLRWVSFMGDNWEHLTKEEAIKVLLAERS